MQDDEWDSDVIDELSNTYEELQKQQQQQQSGVQSLVSASSGCPHGRVVTTESDTT